MKKILIYCTIVLLTAVISIAIFDYLRGSESKPEGVSTARFYSAVLNEEREIIIHFPAGYDSTKRYPVIYVLDGSSEDGHVVEKFNILSTAGYAPATIVVGIPNMSAENRERNLTPPFMKTKVDDVNSALGEGDKFLEFMESELFPFVEENYGASRQRLFHGHSRGGLLVMYSLIYKPDLFQARFCYSAPLWRQDNILVNKVSDYLISHDTVKTFLFMSAGENETDNIKKGLGLLTESLKKKTPAEMVWHSELTNRANHQNNSHLSAAAGIGKWCRYVSHDEIQ